MDLFMTLLLTVVRTFRLSRTANVWDGTRYTFKPKRWDRTSSGQFLTSRIPSYIDVSLVKFFIQTKMSAVVRKRGWIPVVLSSVQVRSQPKIPGGPLTIYTRVVGWHDQYVEIWHTWEDDRGDEVLHSIYLTRVTHSGPDKVTGADMLEALGEPVMDMPLSQAAARLLSDYLRVKDANQKRKMLTQDYASSLKLKEQP